MILLFDISTQIISNLHDDSGYDIVCPKDGFEIPPDKCDTVMSQIEGELRRIINDDT